MGGQRYTGEVRGIQGEEWRGIEEEGRGKEGEVRGIQVAQRY